MNKAAVLGGLAAFSGLVFIATPFIGMETVPLSAVWQWDGGTESSIFWKIRAPRVCTAFVAGSALALGGMAFQAVFRNPLATPFTLGVASGASLGASLAVRFGLGFGILGISSTTICAFAGALLSVALVYGLTQARRGFSTATMLLAGVAVSFFFSSLILFVQYTADFYNSFRLLRWLMGGLGIVGFDSFFNMLPFAAAGMLIVALHGHELNLLTTGDDIALSRGVDVKRTKRALFFATSLAVGGVVAVCGPIGFVGMMAPHICRLLIGPDHRWLAPASCLFGGAFLTLCDTFARTVIAPTELPVGVVTAFLGGPFFIWLLLTGLGERNLA